MLFRFLDNAIYDNDTEPYTTLWIEASSANEAYERAVTLLSFAWRVPPEKVCVQGMGRMEYEVLDAVEDKDGRDRRLWATGSSGSSIGPIPLYSKQRVMLVVAAKERVRLLTAWREAQRHAEELASVRDGEALALREAGNVREAEHREWDAKSYREFAAADLI